MTKLLYNIFTWVYPTIIRLLSSVNPKAKLWIEGRKNIFQDLKTSIKTGEKIIWMHCASLGEFEQGRPVMEKLKMQNVECKILLTFFSPSGYEVSRDYNGADYIFYLPMDSSQNAKSFFDIVRPTLIIFVKYEFWYYYLNEAKQRHIPLILISGIFRKEQAFFKWYGNLYRSMLQSFHHLFVQNKYSADLLASIGSVNNVTIAGDTRFDRVIEIAEDNKTFAEIEKFIDNADVVVAGSTWSEDDEELDHFANTNPQVKFIIAPHNIGKDRIDECLKLYKNSTLYSHLNTQSSANKNVLIIDNVGMLSRLYKYATVCYVGGGFGDDGVHNILEAAVYGRPVVFGPEYEKFLEAEELVEVGGGFSIENALELEQLLKDLLKKKENYLAAAKTSKEYVYSKRGSSDAIINYIQAKRLLTS